MIDNTGWGGGGMKFKKTLCIYSRIHWRMGASVSGGWRQTQDHPQDWANVLWCLPPSWWLPCPLLPPLSVQFSITAGRICSHAPSPVPEAPPGRTPCSHFANIRDSLQCTAWTEKNAHGHLSSRISACRPRDTNYEKRQQDRMVWEKRNWVKNKSAFSGPTSQTARLGGRNKFQAKTQSC